MTANKLRRVTIILSILACFLYLFQIESLLHLYKPHSISEPKAAVIIQAVKLFNEIGLGRFGVYSNGNFSLNKESFTSWAAMEGELETVKISPGVQSELKELVLLLDSVNVFFAEKDGPNYFFFTYYEPRKPVSDGILYMSSDDDPNNSSNEYVSRYAPYQKIADNWYHSSKLIVVRKEDDLIREDWPNALIDKSNSFSKDAIILLSNIQ